MTMSAQKPPPTLDLILRMCDHHMRRLVLALTNYLLVRCNDAVQAQADPLAESLQYQSPERLLYPHRHLFDVEQHQHAEARNWKGHPSTRLPQPERKRALRIHDTAWRSKSRRMYILQVVKFSCIAQKFRNYYEFLSDC
jgi:hypothetical protein